MIRTMQVGNEKDLLDLCHEERLAHIAYVVKSISR